MEESSSSSSSSVPPISWEDRLIPIVPGFTGQDLWPSLNLVLCSWILLVMLPRWKWTPALTLVAPVFHAVLYTSGMILLNLHQTASGDEAIDLTSYHGVVTMFTNPNVVFVGWVHYVVFDCLVGRMMVMDSVQLGASITFHILVVVPSLLLTLMAGPMGWLTYMGFRQIFLIPSAKSETFKVKLF